MFLATTALSEFWDREKEILFLGGWCLREDQRMGWERLRYQILPSPWDDRKRFYDACGYLDERYERLLGALTGYMNVAHRVSLSQRYWKILLGPWLLHSLHVSYDRYICLLEALHCHPNLETVVLDPKSFWVPRTTMESRNLSLDDPFNLQIISQHLRAMRYDFPTRHLQDDWAETTNGGWRKVVRRGAKRTLGLLCGAICRVWQRERQIALCYMYCPPPQIAELVWRTKFQAVPFESKIDQSPTLPEPCFDERREGLASIPHRDEFERAFIRSLPQNFPVIYLEGFHKVRDEMLRRVPVPPQVLVSAVGWWFVSEPFKFLAAEAAQRGCRLITVQHGGGYGLSRYHPCEEHESRVGDTYMVWGWADQRSESCRNLPNPKLSSLFLNQSKNGNRHRSRTILFVATDYSRYLHRFQSNPTGNQWANYLDWERRFLKAVPASLHPSILFRPHQHGHAYVIKDEITKKFPGIEWDEGVPFDKRLKSTRIVVIDHPGTTLLETLVANVPTVSFWDSHHWEMRNVAEPYFESLRRVGILWDSPEAASAKVEEIYCDPWSWWGSHEVQQVRKEFADRYALAREDWADCWANALAEELSLSRKEH